MAKINVNTKYIQEGYLFSEIARRAGEFQREHPDLPVMKLGVGNTTESIPASVINGLRLGVEKLSQNSTYTGYGDEVGDFRLRSALAQWYLEQSISLRPEEIFMSDGAKCDAGNIQSIFAANSIVAVQDPVYPAYVDGAVISGKAGKFYKGKYSNIVYLPCTKDNDFFPVLPEKHVDLIYICSPNNPTGAVATKQQLKLFVNYAREHKAVIIFDAAYSAFIKDKKLPKSIYEIPGAKSCAIEINSFSKSAGFTGVRLGWTVVPHDLVIEGTSKGEMTSLWDRRQRTMFNGPSNISQEGGLAVLTKKGQQDCQKIIDYYMKNASYIRSQMIGMEAEIYGGENAPYIWMKTPNGISSWDFFDILLQKTNVVCTPGAGFGLEGEGYVRLSAFGHRENIEKAMKSIERNLSLRA